VFESRDQLEFLSYIRALFAIPDEKSRQNLHSHRNGDDLLGFLVHLVQDGQRDFPADNNCLFQASYISDSPFSVPLINKGYGFNQERRQETLSPACPV
jgi:hypothetical protein